MPAHYSLSVSSDLDDDVFAVSPDYYSKCTYANAPLSRQNKLDEALLSSGRLSDALQSLLEWLGKSEAYLSEDQPILGDLDTVSLLIEQHKVSINTLCLLHLILNTVCTYTC